MVGGGITGLAAAHAFVRAGVDVTLIEAASRLGGCIEGTTIAGTAVEAGPDAFLARVPWAVELARDIGLGDELVAPVADRASVWSRGRLRPLPEGLLLGVPTDIVGAARSGVLSIGGLARAALDLVLPRTRFVGDVSVAEVVGSRFGREVVERLVDPLIGGINAGDSASLSAEGVAPQVLTAARSHRSLVLGARSQRTGANAASGPVFLTVRAGLSALVERLALDVDVRLDEPIVSLADLDGDVVLAVPARIAAEVVASRSPEAARGLRTIRAASVAIVVLAYPATAFAAPLEGSGFVVPRVEGRLLTACSFATNKWAQWRADGTVVLRASVGRADDDSALALDDDTLVARVHDELATMVGVLEAPLEAQVRRWPEAFPQYEVGHLARVEAIERALAHDAPGVVVTGASYRGLGIPACIRQGQEAAIRLVNKG